jgi:signal transduction histidine kinase
MGINSLLVTYLILNALKSLIYIFILIVAVRRLQDRTSPVLWLLGYAALAFAAHLFQLAVDWSFFPGLDPSVRLRVDEYVALFLALILYQGLRVFLGKDRQWVVLLGGLALSVVLIFLQNVLFVFLLWLTVTVVSGIMLLRTLGQTRQHLHRNRMFYWLPVLLLAASNELMIFYRQGLDGGYFRLGAVMMMAYVVLRHHIPDTRDFGRQFIIYFTTALVTVAFYVAGFTLAQFLLSSVPGYDPLFVGAALAVMISLIFTPLFGFVRNQVNRLFKLQSYDASQTLREYSASISNILDLEKLVTVAIGIITSALEIETGFLFLIDPEIGEDGNNVFRLTGVRSSASAPAVGGKLVENSPIVQYLREERSPLLQYDIDFAPAFMEAPLSERKWLSGLMLDVYVPIFSKGEWIGLLGLGPKPNSRYTDEDLNMLATIASQTGVALENARLVENLKRLNAQVREAYTYLDKANHDLAKLEMTKSNFISIASHELRTPLTVARGYAEMLLEEPSLPDGVRELVKGIHKSTLRQHEIMDSMFDIAQMDTRSLELQKQDVFITELIRSVAQELSKSASERSLEFTLDLPQLTSIKADPNTLRKLFYHLMINAIKFTPNGGKVTVTGRQLPANNRDLPEGGVEIIVSDTGVGVDKGYQEVIFTKFYQPGELLNRHSTGKTKFKGSGVGLGLALSRGIVDAHGGKIWVESSGYDEEKCPGSDFHVILPLRSQGESKTVRMGSAVKLKL